MIKAQVKSNISKQEIEEYSKEVLNNIVNDEEFYQYLLKLNFNYDDITKFLALFNDFRNDYYLEKKIKTYADCVKYNKFTRINLIKDGEQVKKEYSTFKPFTDFLIYQNSFYMKDFDEQFDFLEFKNINNPTVKSLIKSENTSKNWIYLHGTNYTGKTYAAICFANTLIRRKHMKCAFTNVPKLFGELSKLYFGKENEKEEFERVLKVLGKIDILVFDDFGGEYKNTIIRDNILIPLLKDRISRGQTTIFTSNFTPLQIKEMYRLNDAGGEIKAQQIVELLDIKVKQIIPTGSNPIY